MRHIVVSVIFSFILTSCASTPPPYAANFPLTNERFISRDGILTGKVPLGWFSATDDTLAPSLVVWLVKENISAAISIQELKLDPLSKKQIEEDGLELLAKLSCSLHSEITSIKTFDIHKFELQNKEFCSYNISVGGFMKQIVVFSAHGRYYECEARPLSSEWSGREVSQLFNAQLTVLSSLQW